MAQISATKCDLCYGNDASIFCYECKQSMCLSCRSFHDKIPSTRKHKMSNLNKVDRLVFQSELECSSHKELFTFFCNHCERLICSLCLLAGHKGHKFSGTEEIFVGARQNTIRLVSKGKEKLEEIKVAIDHVNSGHREKIEQDSDQVELQIKSTAEALHGIIDIVKDILVNEVTDYKQLENEQIDRTVRKLEKLKVDYENTTSTFNQLLTETHDTTFYQSYDTHKSTFDKLDDIPKYSKPDDIRIFDEEAFLVEILFKMKKRFNSAKAAVKIVAKKDVQNKDLTKIESEKCAICMNVFNNPKYLGCGHEFCSTCIHQQFEYEQVCPVCDYIPDLWIDIQPPGEMKVTLTDMSCFLEVEFKFLPGLQSSDHPNPGNTHYGLIKTIAFQVDDIGRRVLKLLRKAFDRQLLFTIDSSERIVCDAIPQTLLGVMLTRKQLGDIITALAVKV